MEDVSTDVSKMVVKKLGVVMYNAHEARPPKSGRYLVVKEYDNIDPDIEFTQYSREHDAFNCTDGVRDPRSVDIDYDWWGEVEELWKDGCK